MPYMPIIDAFWGLFCLYWITSARSSKPDISREAAPRQLLSSGGFIVGALLLFSRMPPDLWLSKRLYSPSSISGTIGCVLGGLGLAVAISARRVLGSNWSRVVAVKENHELVMTGPYRLVRHPIYSGMLLLVLGTAVVLGQVKGFAGLMFVLGSALFRVFAEDQLMASTFPDTFPGYRERTKRLVPWIF